MPVRRPVPLGWIFSTIPLSGNDIAFIRSGALRRGLFRIDPSSTCHTRFTVSPLWSYSHLYSPLHWQWTLASRRMHESPIRASISRWNEPVPLQPHRIHDLEIGNWYIPFAFPAVWNGPPTAVAQAYDVLYAPRPEDEPRGEPVFLL